MSLKEAQDKVATFHRKFDVAAPARPLEIDQIDWSLHEVRADWIESELTELRDGVCVRSDAEIADAYVDILVFALGGLVKLGIDGSPLFDAVVESQMTKVRVPGKTKLQKPPGWKHPDIAALIEEQRKGK